MSRAERAAPSTCSSSGRTWARASPGRSSADPLPSRSIRTRSGGAGDGPAADLAAGVDPLDVPHQSEPFHQADEPARDVELAAVDPVHGRRGEGVVVVVPGLAQRRKGEEPVVAALVPAGIRPAPEHVADRVDAPGDVLEERDPHQAAPHGALDAAPEPG